MKLLAVPVCCVPMDVQTAIPALLKMDESEAIDSHGDT